MNADDVRFFASFEEQADEIPEGESEPGTRAEATLPGFVAEEIEF